jgi:predicted transcriptional regulator
LSELTKKILALPTYYCITENYISTYSIQQGTVCQALCSGLRQLVKEYKMMVIQFDEEVAVRGLTLQEIWYHIQPSLQLMESIVELIREAQQKKGGQLITCILKMLNGTTSEQVVKIYRFLFEKCMRVYIQMIAKWIYEGVI